ncbi:hypothetical protein [Rheinheimera tilapiae]|uniref:HEPN domain-containing protein n=1 Tax=Rheinheimera tilapiae TaxID=875043 RepID=A0ABV6BKP0_9GAMM
MIFQPPRQNYQPLTEREEEYFHLVNCLSCFERAIKILEELDGHVDMISTTLQDAATRLAIIEYAKAYTSAFGSVKYRYKLTPPELSKENFYLHKVVMELRDKVLAHSDLIPKQGKVHYQPLGSTEPALVSLFTDPTLPSTEKLLSLFSETVGKIKITQQQLSNALPR